MAKKRTLTAEGVQSVRVPRHIPFQTQAVEDGLLLIAGESGHTHELLLKMLEDAEQPRHDDVEAILVAAAKIVRGGMTTLSVEQDGLRVNGCPMHPVKFLPSLLAKHRLAIEKCMLSNANTWIPPVDSLDEQTGEIVFGGSTADLVVPPGGKTVATTTL